MNVDRYGIFVLLVIYEKLEQQSVSMLKRPVSQ